MKKEVSPPHPASLLHFSFYSGFWTQKQQEEEEWEEQGGSAFVELLFLTNKMNQPNLQKKVSTNVSRQFISDNLTQGKLS